jgi:hypothetical protein
MEYGCCSRRCFFLSFIFFLKIELYKIIKLFDIVTMTKFCRLLRNTLFGNIEISCCILIVLQSQWFV